MQRLACVIRNGVVRNRSRFDALADGRELVGKAARGATGDCGRNRRVLCGSTEERRPIAGIGRRFRARNERRSELRGDRPQGERRGDSGAVHNAAGRDHRSRDLLHKEPRQSHSAESIVSQAGLKHAAMAAGFVALRNDGIDSGRRNRLRFGKIRGRAKKHDTGGP